MLHGLKKIRSIDKYTNDLKVLDKKNWECDVGNLQCLTQQIDFYSCKGCSV